MNTKEKVMQALQKFGLQPETDEDKVCFYYQMSVYLYAPDENDENYVAMYLPSIYDVTEDNEYDVYCAINECNLNMKATKLVVVANTKVWACYEVHVPEEGNLEDVVIRGVLTLYETKERFTREMKGL